MTQREIILVRHGKPGRLPGDMIAGDRIGCWVRDYDKVGISRDLVPPDAVQHAASESSCLVASDLPRSIESALWLSPADRVRIEPGLREAVLPHSLGLRLQLPPAAWVIIARVAWWLDLCPSPESIAATRQRAAAAANRLSELSKQHRRVLVVGHGMFNRFVATQLLQRGWRGPRHMPVGYWGLARFVRSEDARSDQKS